MFKKSFLVVSLVFVSCSFQYVTAGEESEPRTEEEVQESLDNCFGSLSPAMTQSFVLLFPDAVRARLQCEKDQHNGIHYQSSDACDESKAYGDMFEGFAKLVKLKNKQDMSALFRIRPGEDIVFLTRLFLGSFRKYGLSNEDFERIMAAEEAYRAEQKLKAWQKLKEETEQHNKEITKKIEALRGEIKPTPQQPEA